MKWVHTLLARAGIFTLLTLTAFHLPAQTTDLTALQARMDQLADLKSLYEALAEAQPVAFDSLPRNKVGQVNSVGYRSMQHPEWPPLPANFFQLDVWPLGDGHFVLDDRTLDYAALQMEAELAAALSLAVPQMRMMDSSLAGYAYGNPVYLTNMVATAGMTAAFDIAGGTNNVPYDIQMTTNLLSAWQWLGIGYTSNRYTFSSQPSDTAFYRLAKPSKTMVVGWGENFFNQCDAPAGLTNALMIAGGGGYTVALLTNGAAVGWGGRISEGSIPTNLTGITMVASGIDHKIAMLTNGAVLAWGANFYGQTNVPAGLTNATVIAAQYLHSLALRMDGTVVVWGGNFNPALTNIPVSLTNGIAIAAGCNHNLAVRAGGTVVAWGDNSSGQCNVPSGLSNVIDVAAGWAHSVALKSDGTVAVWGNNTLGETNTPPGLTNVVAIAAAGYPNYSGYTLALKKDGSVVAWGKSKVTLPLGGLNNVIAVGAEYDSAFAIRTGPPTPVITLEPTDQFQIASRSVSFAAKGQGLYGVSYQWQTNGVNLSGATNATLMLTNVETTQQATYRAIITDNNGYGSIVSSSAELIIVPAPEILSQSPMPTNQVAVFKENLTLSVTPSLPIGDANGFPSVYQWRFNGTNIAGATATNYTIFMDSNLVGSYSVVASNAAGSVTSLVWQVTMTYVGSYIDVGTLAYHLSTNAVGRTNSSVNIGEFYGWSSGTYTLTNMGVLTNTTWSPAFWLKGVCGLSATCFGYSNAPSGTGGQGPMTLISPRHYICATHMHPESYMNAFLDTNNVIHWRRSIQRTNWGNDISVGIFDADLPPSVEYLPVLPTNYWYYIPTNGGRIIQGIGMNQHKQIFAQPMSFTVNGVGWNSANTAPFGVTTNWNVNIFPGDSSCPEMILVGNQLVLVSHNSSAGSGGNYAFYFDVINEKMHYLSTNNAAGTDYQLKPFSLTNWPAIY